MAQIYTFPRPRSGVPNCFIEETTYQWQVNSYGLLEVAPPEWELLTGQGQAESKGFGWLGALHADDRERVARLWFRAMLNTSSLHIEFLLILASGRYVPTEAVATPVLDNAGKVEYWEGTTITKVRLISGTTAKTGSR